MTPTRSAAPISEIVIKRKIAGSKATGRVSMTHSMYDASTGMFVGCSGEAKFTSKRR